MYHNFISEISVRIDPEIAALLERIARLTGRMKFDLVRYALVMLRAHGTETAAKPPAETMTRLIGCWDSGGQQLSKHTGARFARLLQEAKHAQRTGRRRPARRVD